MIDAVLTHPHHPSLCGVAKFSMLLAQHLGVPCHGNLSTDAAHPLFSVKGTEGSATWRERASGSFDLFAHDASGFVLSLAVTAHRVFAANAVIAETLQAVRPDVRVAYCPSLMTGTADRGLYNVLTFGMAHKLRMPHYEALKATLDAEWGTDYTVSVTTAIHEGSPWDETAVVADKLRGIFGDQLRVLGYLADDALAKEIDDADAIALFFDPAVRDNNTSYWLAVDSGKRLFTNRDHRSPRPHERRTWAGLVEVIHAA